MGNGSWTDDFLHKGEMFREVLARRYFDDDSTLILNGDVEDFRSARAARRINALLTRAPEAIVARRRTTDLIPA